MMIDRVKTNVLKSSASDEVSERQERMFGMAQATARRRSLNGCACLHLCTWGTGTLSKQTHFKFKEVVLAFGALALLCLAPHFTFAKESAGLIDYRTVLDPSQASAANGISAQGAQTTKQQEPNPQPDKSTTERAVLIPPQIIFEDGQLTIIAENSRLSDILTALHTAIGADIDVPATVARQRIWVRLGPGPARTVLRDLLDNTELDYVIQASDTDPDAIRTVLLSLRSNTGEQGGPGGSRMARGGTRNSLPYENPNSVEVADQDPSTAGQSAAVSNADPAAPPRSADGPSPSVRTPPAPVVSDSSLSKPGGSGSAAQMIQQLQSMYQQRRQMQIQQNQKPPSNNND